MKWTVLFLLIVTSGLRASASEYLLINIYNQEKISNLQFRTKVGSYTLINDGKIGDVIQSAETVKVSAKGNQVALNYKGKSLLVQNVAFQTATWMCEFLLDVPAGLKDQIYQDNLIIYAANGQLTLINEVEIDHYVAGVVEAESGKDQLAEYYKVQSIISRTYALANKTRHMGRGYQLCDRVHCQVYHGKSRWNDSIPYATNETEGLVLVDQDINLITAAFSSNCGGQTLNAEHVWSQPRSYLVSVPDTFCLVMPHSNWETTVDKKAWLNYLRKENYPVNDSIGDATFYFPQDKSSFFSDSSYHVKLTDLRRKFKLRSTFFTVQEDGENKLRLIGQGFGHGVGLCQEGAMNRARCGWDYRSILHHYYTNVHLIHLNSLDFFRFQE